MPLPRSVLRAPRDRGQDGLVAPLLPRSSSPGEPHCPATNQTSPSPRQALQLVSAGAASYLSHLPHSQGRSSCPPLTFLLADHEQLPLSSLSTPIPAALQIRLRCAVEFLCTKQFLNKDINTKAEEAHLDLILLQEEQVGKVKAAGWPRGDGHGIIKFLIPMKEKRKASKVKTAGLGKE